MYNYTSSMEYNCIPLLPLFSNTILDSTCIILHGLSLQESHTLRTFNSNSVHSFVHYLPLFAITMVRPTNKLFFVMWLMDPLTIIIIMISNPMHITTATKQMQHNVHARCSSTTEINLKNLYRWLASPCTCRLAYSAMLHNAEHNFMRIDSDPW